MSGGFVKLYGTILTSSIWLEDDATLRVWITMLATADENGYVGASVGGLAHVARVSRPACQAALDKFLAPDEDSRTEDNDGRRIERVEGGWLILNHRKYRDMRTQKQIRDANRIAGKRLTGEYDDRGPATRSNVATEAEAYTEELPPHPARDPSEQKPYDKLLERIGDEDLPYLLGRIENSGLPAYAWVAEIGGLLDGMHGPAVDPDAMKQAVRDYVAAFPKQPSLKHFRSFVRSVEKERVSATPPFEERRQGARAPGNTLRAGEIINEVKKCRNPQFPTNATAGWRDKLTQQEVRAVNAIGVQRILGEDKPGIVLSQLAKMLTEAE